jgi:uncharacterized protein (DUF1499 family)
MKKVARMLIPILIAAVLLVIVVPRFVVPAISPRPTNLGVKNGKLASCPRGYMNCVSTQEDSLASRKMTPLSYTGSMADAKVALLRLIEGDGATVVDASQPDYIHAEYRTRMMQFIDDVEFYIDDAAKVIHFRSASRIGRGDMGANKARMEDFSRRFIAETANVVRQPAS